MAEHDDLLARAVNFVTSEPGGVAEYLVADLAAALRSERVARERAEAERDRARDNEAFAENDVDNLAAEVVEWRLRAERAEAERDVLTTISDKALNGLRGRAERAEQQLAAITERIDALIERMPIGLTEYGQGRKDALREARALLDASTTEEPAECGCADCDLPAGHAESPDPGDVVIPRQPGKLVGHLKFVPASDTPCPTCDGTRKVPAVKEGGLSPRSEADPPSVEIIAVPCPECSDTPEGP